MTPGSKAIFRSAVQKERETAPRYQRPAVAAFFLSQPTRPRLELGRRCLGVTLLCAQLLACEADGPDESRKAQAPQGGNETVQQGSSTALESAVAGLIESLGADDDDKRQQAIDSLAAMGSPVIDLVAAALRDPSAERRTGAVEVLSEIGGTVTVPPLLEALQDASEDVRLMAVEALGEIRDPRAVQPLLELYGRDENKQVRYECLTSLGAIGDPAVAPLLARETQSDDPYVRVWAIDALCVMGDARARELALLSLKDSYRGVRRRVLRSCARVLDTPAGQEALLDVALHDEDVELAIWARQALIKQMQGPSGTSDRTEQVRAAAVKALNARGADALRAAFLLGELGDARATARLIAALDDPNPLVRDHAAHLLGRIADPRAVPPLIRALDDQVPMIRATAHSSLTWFAKDGDERARKAIESYTGPKLPQPLPR